MEFILTIHPTDFNIYSSFCAAFILQLLGISVAVGGLRVKLIMLSVVSVPSLAEAKN